MADSRDDNPKKDEEDQVTQAYEDISKRLEHIRKDRDDDDSDEDESSDEKEPLDPLPGTDEKEEDDKEEPKPTFKPREDDPLDKEEVEEEKSQPDEEESLDEFEEKPHHQEKSEQSLDDLAEEEKKEQPRVKSFEAAEDFDEGHDIPNLRPGHEGPFGDSKPGGGYSSDVSFSKPNHPEPSHPNNYFNRHTAGTPSRRGNFLHLIILILIGLAVIGGTVYLLKYQFSGAPAPTPSPSPAASTEPTPEPTPAFDRSKFKIRVLNGTTTSGLAKTISDKLKGLGYQIDKTGNAPKQDFKSSVIKVKPAAAGLADELIKDLGSEYSASASGELKDSDASDAEVILGTK